MALSRDMWFQVRDFLNNRERIEFMCVCKVFRHLSCAVFHSLTVLPTDDLNMSFRRFMTHKQTLGRTVLIQMNVDEEWPFETQEMVLIGCTKRKPFSPKVKKVTQLRYRYQWNPQLE